MSKKLNFAWFIIGIADALIVSFLLWLFYQSLSSVISGVVCVLMALGGIWIALWAVVPAVYAKRHAIDVVAKIKGRLKGTVYEIEFYAFNRMNTFQHDMKLSKPPEYWGNKVTVTCLRLPDYSIELVDLSHLTKLALLWTPVGVAIIVIGFVNLFLLF